MRKLFQLRAMLVVVGMMAWMLSSVAPARAQAKAGNPELDALLNTGVQFSAGQSRKLRTPSMADGLTAAAQQQVITNVLAMQTAARRITYQKFIFKNLNSPYVMLIDQDPTYDQGQPGHSINLWFVCYGELKTVADPKFLKSQFKPGQGGKIDVIPVGDLQARGIVPRVIPGGKEYFVHGLFKLLPTQVTVQSQATCRAVDTTTDESATLACQIDRRFNGDAKYPNDWRPAPGGVVQPNANLYSGFGGYAKVTKLIQPAGALFVEYHLVYDEPQAWFNGANLLRSKLPQSAPDDVRSFRRDVKDAGL